MYKVRNKLTAIIVAIALLFMLAVPMLVWQTIPVKAATITTGLTFKDITASVDKLSAEGYKWENNAGNYKLTLNGFDQDLTTGSSGIYFDKIPNVSIEIIGNNKIKLTKTGNGAPIISGGIISQTGNISIEGAGDLQIEATGVDFNSGICAINGSIDATKFTGLMTIVVESNYDTSTFNTTSSGIRSRGSLKISGGTYTIKVSGGRTNVGIESFSSQGGVFISGGIIDISADKATKTDSTAYGIDGYAGVTISGESTIVDIYSDSGPIYSSTRKIQFTDVHPLGQGDQGGFVAELKRDFSNLVYKNSGIVANNIQVKSKDHYAIQYTEAGHLSDCICTQESQTLPHTWNAGSITKEPTETATGIKTFTCTLTDCARTRQETLPMLSGGGESGDGEETTPLRLSIGAIAGITVASVVVAGGGGFCLWWFLLLPFLRKRKEEKIEIAASQDSQENDKKD